MSEQIWWYIARSGGIVALVLSGASVIWGLLLGTRIMEGRPGPKWLLDLHKWLGGTTLVFTAIHVIALMADSFIEFSLLDVLVPGVADWNTAAVAFGIVAAWLLMAVQVTSIYMKRLPRRLWKWVHLSSYAMLWTGIVHGAMAGTDAGNPLYIAGVSLMALTTVFLTGYRVLSMRRRVARPAMAT